MVNLLRRPKPNVSRVNARHLIDDLASSYTYSLEEAVLVEMIANALDASASIIKFNINVEAQVITMQDNGVGMNLDEFQAYHDLAQSLKLKGGGIGFAGLGAKLAHKITRKVVTETRRGNYRDSSEWAYKGDQLEWKHGRSRTLDEDGTKIDLHLQRKWARLLDTEFLKHAIFEHFGALLDPYLSELYMWDAVYPNGVDLYVNGMQLPRQPVFDSTQMHEIKTVEIYDRTGKKRRRIGRGIFVLTKDGLAEKDRGLIIATYGKTIRVDSLGIYPRQPDHITGWVEIPQLVGSLTLNKQDFQTEGRAGQKYRAVRRQLQEVFTAWLGEIGESREQEERQRVPRRLETETAKIIQRLPELKGFYAARLTSPVAALDNKGTIEAVVDEGAHQATGGTGRDGDGEGNAVRPGEFEGLIPREEEGGTSRIQRQSRTLRIGPQIERVADGDRPDMSWLEGEKLLINVAHPTHQMASRRGLLGYHERFAIFYALCKEAPIEPDEKLGLVARALTEWSKSQS